MNEVKAGESQTTRDTVQNDRPKPATQNGRPVVSYDFVVISPLPAARVNLLVQHANSITTNLPLPDRQRQFGGSGTLVG